MWYVASASSTHAEFSDASDVNNTAIDAPLQQWHEADSAHGVHDSALRRGLDLKRRKLFAKCCAISLAAAVVPYCNFTTGRFHIQCHRIWSGTTAGAAVSLCKTACCCWLRWGSSTCAVSLCRTAGMFVCWREWECSCGIHNVWTHQDASHLSTPARVPFWCTGVRYCVIGRPGKHTLTVVRSHWYAMTADYVVLVANAKFPWCRGLRCQTLTHAALAASLWRCPSAYPRSATAPWAP